MIKVHVCMSTFTQSPGTICYMLLYIISDQFKPTVAHRDINTRNILVTPDNSCIVGDLGFAIATVGSKLMKNGHYESAEQASLQDVCVFFLIFLLFLDNTNLNNGL